MSRLRNYVSGEGKAFFAAVILLTLIPLLPEYCAPFLAIGSLIAAGRDAAERHASLQIGTLGQLVLLFCVYSAVGITYSAHPLNSAATVTMWLVMLCGYVALTTVLTSRRRIRYLLFFVAVAAGIVGCIGCLQYLLRDWLRLPLPNQVWLSLDEFLYRNFPLDLDLHMADERAASTFTNSNMYSEYLVMVLPLVGYYSFGGQRTRLSLLARGFLIAAVLGTVVSFSRGAYIALLSMLLLIIVMHLRQITPFILCLIAGISLIPEAVFARFMSIGSMDHSISERFAIWEVAVQAIIQHPLLGMGPGVSNFWEYLQFHGVDAPHAHNLPLQLLVEGGFIGLFLMSLVGTKLLQSGLEMMNRSSQTRASGQTFVIFTIAFVLYGMVDFPFLSPKLVGVFLMVLGIADALSALYFPNQTTPLRRLFHPLWRKLASGSSSHKHRARHQGGPQ